MFRNASLFFSSIVAGFTFQGCTAFDAPASQPGMSHREVQALVKTYYWQRRFPIPSYSDDQLAAFLLLGARQVPLRRSYA